MKKIISFVTMSLCMCSYAQSWSLTGNAGNTTANFLGTTDNKPLVFKINNVEKMRLKGDALGIGTNLALIPVCVDLPGVICDKYRLYVKDGIRTEKVKVDVSADNGWADYVFADNYPLQNLNSLEQFIKKNKHLPEVPTTEEVIRDGVELKEMNILLLKKIEELTLHLIQQNKRIEELENKFKN